MDLGFLDEPPRAEEAQKNEKDLLYEVARFIPLLDYKYDSGVSDGKEHLGFITQALEKVKGLDTAVIKTPGQPDQFDGAQVAAAALSVASALARIVLGVKLDSDYDKDVTNE